MSSSTASQAPRQLILFRAEPTLPVWTSGRHTTYSQVRKGPKTSTQKALDTMYFGLYLHIYYMVPFELIQCLLKLVS